MTIPPVKILLTMMINNKLCCVPGRSLFPPPISSRSTSPSSWCCGQRDMVCPARHLRSLRSTGVTLHCRILDPCWTSPWTPTQRRPSGSLEEPRLLSSKLMSVAILQGVVCLFVNNVHCGCWLLGGNYLNINKVIEDKSECTVTMHKVLPKKKKSHLNNVPLFSLQSSSADDQERLAQVSKNTGGWYCDYLTKNKYQTKYHHRTFVKNDWPVTSASDRPNNNQTHPHPAQVSIVLSTYNDQQLVNVHTMILASVDVIEMSFLCLSPVSRSCGQHSRLCG